LLLFFIFAIIKAAALPCTHFISFLVKNKPMEYSNLGKTDLLVSKICLGTMTFGRQNNEAEGHEQLNYALSQGVNFIDTAEMYAVPPSKETQGETERIIGTWLKNRTDRDKIVLATKITGPSAMTYIRNPLRFDKTSIQTAINGSLQRLQTDYVDLYQLHWPERKVNSFSIRNYPAGTEAEWEDNFLETLESLTALVREGKVRHIGVSNETPWGVMRLLQLAAQHGLERLVSIQNPYSLLNRTFEIGLSEVAMRENVGLLAYSPLGFGVLSGKYHGETPPADGRITLFPQYKRYSSERAMTATQQYLDIAAKHNLTGTQLALAFVNSRPFTTATIVGATTLAQLKENIATIEVNLSQQILNEIEKVNDVIPNPAP
jgi:aryl-alcohol dehydrogenase-like predicted oxidoreductase